MAKHKSLSVPPFPVREKFIPPHRALDDEARPCAIPGHSLHRSQPNTHLIFVANRCAPAEGLCARLGLIGNPICVCTSMSMLTTPPGRVYVPQDVSSPEDAQQPGC